jgi:DNA-binding LacI/PurR family transcriptional regulator
MHDYNATLTEIAKSVGLNAEILESYLYGTLDPLKKSTLVEPRIAYIEQQLVEGGTAVYYALLYKSVRPVPKPRTSSDFISKLLQGVYDHTRERGYELLHLVNHCDLATEDYFRTILEKYPDAGALMFIPKRADTLVAVCTEMRHHCLILDYQNAPDGPAHSLNVDNYGAVAELTGMLIELGHRRIAFITGLLEFDSAAQRYAGYKAALESASILFDPVLVKHGNWGMDLAEQLLQEFILLPDPPTAVVCSNDLTALGAYTAINAAGLSIPDDISVTGFDDIPLVANIDPPLTTVRQPLVEMGRYAAHLLIEAMEGRLTDTFQHEHPLEIQVRQSIGPPPR